jgi:hypothetical protein
VLVAFLAASAAEVLMAKITSTLEPMISSARVFSRSIEFFAELPENYQIVALDVANVT